MCFTSCSVNTMKVFMHITWIFKLCNKKNVNILPWRKHVTAFQTGTAVQWFNCNCSSTTLKDWNQNLYQNSLSTVMDQKSDKKWQHLTKLTCPMRMSYLLSGWVSNIPYERSKAVTLTVPHSLRTNWNLTL